MLTAYFLLLQCFADYLLTLRQDPMRPNGVFIDDVSIERLQFPPENIFMEETSIVNRSSLNNYMELYSNGTSMFPIAFYEITYHVHYCQGYLPKLLLNVSGNCEEDCITSFNIRLGSTPIEGTFDLSFKGIIIRDIKFDTETEGLKEHLENSLSGYKFEIESIDPQCYRREWRIEWSNKGGDQPAFQVNVHDLSSRGTTVSATVHEDIHGGILLRPIRGDMLRQPYIDPQVSMNSLIRTYIQRTYMYVCIPH